MAKIKTYEEALDKQVEQKAALSDKKAELTAYLKENKLKRNKVPEGKHAKAVDKMESSITTREESLAKTNALVKELKPKKERKTSYDYPDGLTAAVKKKYRTKMRNQAKAKDKPAKEKKAKKEKPAKEGKAEKKSKKSKKSKKASAED